MLSLSCFRFRFGGLSEFRARLSECRTRYKVFFACFALVVSWFVVGTIKSKRAKDESFLQNVESNSTYMEISELVAEERVVRKTFAAKVYAWKSVDIVSEVSGSVKQVFFDNGTPINRDQVILVVDDRGKEGRAQQAEALLHKRELEHVASESLTSDGYGTRAHKYGADAALLSAEADLNMAKLDLNNTKIKSPFAGIVDWIVPQVGSFVHIGQVVAKVLNFEKLKVVAYLPEGDLIGVNLGDSVEVIFDYAEGPALQGKVSSVCSVISDQVELCKVEVLIDGGDNKEIFVVDGVPARAKFAVGTVNAHKIPSSAITVNGDGILGIKVLDSENAVHFVDVDVVDSDDDGCIWVTGVPDAARLISRGHELVIAGSAIMQDVST
ncbi:efflux RND transporter periplasmic adaptor subunit [Anaplasma bovis]|uniref:efflux RND transporter periplasmic adaptor subunit n=1 Tax=Anaplasma bovis TaxID=186733 RepID=UPI002FF20C60